MGDRLLPCRPDPCAERQRSPGAPRGDRERRDDPLASARRIQDRAEPEALGRRGAELAPELPRSVKQHGTAGRIGHVQQPPWKPEFDQAGGRIGVPVGQAALGLGPESQYAAVVALRGKEGAVPAKACPVRDHEHRIEPAVGVHADGGGAPVESAVVIPLEDRGLADIRIVRWEDVKRRLARTG